LRIAAWLTWSLYQRESFVGLQAGLGMLRYLCSERWETLFPQKSRTRIAAFTWLIPRMEQAVAEMCRLASSWGCSPGWLRICARWMPA